MAEQNKIDMERAAKEREKKINAEKKEEERLRSLK